MRIENGIGWVEEDGKLVSATPAQYVAEINQLRGNLSLAEENERLREFISAFQELLDLDPENHPGTDLGRLMLEITEYLRHPPQPAEQESDRKFGVEDGYKPGWTEDT